jgi:hypothetical protein
MANPPLTDLPGFAGKHLYYETLMFVTARDKLFQLAALREQQQQHLPPQPPQPEEEFNWNLLVEASALHFRNLVDFFYPSPIRHSDDVTAVNYVASWGSPARPIDLSDAHKRANKELAHLTLKRKAGPSPDKSWDFGAMSIAMKPVIEEFLNRVDPKNVPAGTVAELRKIGGTMCVTGGPVFHSSSY